jgi:multidrug efflux pump subunit AcrA (membrane-fusion protein)
VAACSKPKGDARKRDRNAPLTVTAVEVRLDPWERSIRLVGTLAANQEARIAAEVEGSIERTHVEVGDAVEAGRELAQIDTDSYQGMVNLQTANLAKAQANARTWRRTSPVSRS